MSRIKILIKVGLLKKSLKLFLVTLLLISYYLSATIINTPIVKEISADTGNIVPNADGTVAVEWSSTGTSYYTEIDEGATPSTTDYMSIVMTADTSYAYIRMSSIASVGSVSQIQLYVYHNDGSNGELYGQLYNDDETTTYSSESVFTRTSTNAWHSLTFSGLSLTQSQLDSLSVRFRPARASGGAPSDVIVYSVYAVVTYTPAPAVSISLSTDGTVSFGYQTLNTTVDTTATGLNDIETISVDSGTANLDVRATSFTDGVDSWVFGSSNGADQVQFDVSKDGTNWTNINQADTLFGFDTSVTQGSTRDLYLRLTTPTSTTSYEEYGTTITIVASSP